MQGKVHCNWAQEIVMEHHMMMELELENYRKKELEQGLVNYSWMSSL